MYKPEEEEAIILEQLKEFKISNEEFIKMIHYTLDRELKEQTLSGPKMLGVVSIAGEVYHSNLGTGLIKADDLELVRAKNDIVVPIINMVKYFTH